MMPIVRKILPHTGRLDGDDEGYRDVVVSDLDLLDPDPMGEINKGVSCYPIYALPARPDICSYYGEGLGTSKTMLLRAPAYYALLDADELLRPYGRRLLVIDAWRSVKTQSVMWAAIFRRIVGERNIGAMSFAEIVKFGLEANKVGAYAPVKQSSEFEEVIQTLLDSMTACDEIITTAKKFDMSEEQSVRLYYTFMTSLGMTDFELDDTANTAHGGGGAVDVYLLNTKTGLPTCLGVPYDYVGRPAVMDYFEHDENFDAFVHELLARPDLREYVGQFVRMDFGIEDFRMVRDERRMLFHAMRAVGATYFSLGADEGEPWHFNLGNELGGKQAELYPGAGNGCQAVLRNIRDPETGERIAVWGNLMGHRLARKILGE